MYEAGVSNNQAPRWAWGADSRRPIRPLCGPLLALPRTVPPSVVSFALSAGRWNVWQVMGVCVCPISSTHMTGHRGEGAAEDNRKANGWTRPISERQLDGWECATNTLNAIVLVFNLSTWISVFPCEAGHWIWPGTGWTYTTIWPVTGWTYTNIWPVTGWIYTTIGPVTGWTYTTIWCVTGWTYTTSSHSN